MARPGPLALALLGAMLLSSAGSLAMPVTPQTSCNLSGTWVNDLGSRMTIEPANAEGVFSGGYRTAVTTNNRPAGPASMQGIVNRGRQPTFGFIVKWPDFGSVSVFAGQCFMDGSGKETLETTWLLRGTEAAQAEDWKATRVGRNVFVRLK